MEESCTRDPGIKLFGTKIPLLTNGDSLATVPAKEAASLAKGRNEENDVKDSQAGKTDGKNLGVAPPTETENSSDSESLLENSVSPKTPSISEESAKSKASKEQTDGSNSQEKPLKKPDKILPCPRCHSIDTKFCYYNNYNVNQPRYFCKACQRYWTAGGTMRNVPVGAGRRKSKSSNSHYRHIMISEAFQATHIDPRNGIHHPTFESNGKVLSFGLDSPTCDSAVSVLNLGDTNAKMLHGSQNGFHKFEQMRISVPCKAAENGDDSNSNTSATVSNSSEDGSRISKQGTQVDGSAPQITYFPCVPWPYAWNSLLPSPLAICPPGYPTSFYHAPYANCGIAWNVPLLPPQSSSPSNPLASCSVPDSPKLGKHLRETETTKANEQESEGELSKARKVCVLVPKVLRVDDPSEVVKSSIWATLGIKNEIPKTGPSLFKGFQSNSNGKEGVLEASPVLRANPAALSRSINFHESS